MEGHFFTTDTWNQFPHGVIGTISAYNDGAISLQRAFEIIGAKYSSSVSQQYTYDSMGHKIPHTIVSFGHPAVTHFVFD